MITTEEKEEPFLKKAFSEIRHLPKGNRLFFETLEQKQLFTMMKTNNKILASWLENIQFGFPLDPICLKGIGAFLMPIAESYLDVLDLCRKIHYVAPDKIEYPAQAWIEAVRNKINSAIETSGLTKGVEAVGKRELFESQSQLISQFENCEVDFYLEPKGVMLILYIAQNIAKEDDVFHEKTWKRYLKKWRKVTRYMAFCKEIQYCTIGLDGTIFTTKAGRKTTLNQDRLILM